MALATLVVLVISCLQASDAVDQSILVGLIYFLCMDFEKQIEEDE